MPNSSPGVPAATPDFLLGEPLSQPGVEGRVLLADESIAERVRAAFESPDDQGEFLASLVRELPRADEGWHSAGAGSWTQDNYAQALLGIVAAAGTNAQTAQAFVERMKADEAGADRKADPFEDVALRITAIVSAWVGEQSDPDAVAILTERFASDMEEGEFVALLQAANANLIESASQRQDPIAKMDSGLAAMAPRISGSNAEIIELFRNEFRPYLADLQIREAAMQAEDEQAAIWKAQDEAILVADIAAQDLGTDRTQEGLDRLFEAIDVVNQFDGAAARSLLLRGMDNAAAGHTDEFASSAERMIDTQLAELKGILEKAKADESLPSHLTSVVDDVIHRRGLSATTVDDGQVVVDEEALGTLGELAASLRIPLEPTNVRREIVEGIPRQQRLLDAKNLIGVDIRDLPPEVMGMSVEYGHEQTPTITFLVAPTENDLDALAATPLNRFGEQRPHLGRTGPDVHEVKEIVLGGKADTNIDLSVFVDFVGRVMNLPPDTSELANVDDRQAAELTTTIEEWDSSNPQVPLQVSDGDRVLEFNVKPGLREHKTSVREGGQVVVPEYVGWDLPVTEDEDKAPSLHVPMSSIGIRLSSPDLSPNDATTRARALQLVYEQESDRETVHPEAPEWVAIFDETGGGRLVIGVDDVFEDVREDVYERAAAGVQDVTENELSDPHPLPDLKVVPVATEPVLFFLSENHADGPYGDGLAPAAAEQASAAVPLGVETGDEAAEIEQRTGRDEDDGLGPEDESGPSGGIPPETGPYDEGTPGGGVVEPTGTAPAELEEFAGGNGEKRVYISGEAPEAGSVLEEPDVLTEPPWFQEGDNFDQLATEVDRLRGEQGDALQVGAGADQPELGTRTPLSTEADALVDQYTAAQAGNRGREQISVNQREDAGVQF